jgi:hypothetical protein
MKRFSEKMMLNIEYFFYFVYRLFRKIFLRIQRNIDINICLSICKLTVIFVRVYSSINFLHGVWKSSQISNVYKVRPMGAAFFDADGRTDGRTAMTNLIVNFWKSAESLKFFTLLHVYIIQNSSTYGCLYQIGSALR